MSCCPGDIAAMRAADVCDRCGDPVAVVSPTGGAWCQRCADKVREMAREAIGINARHKPQNEERKND